MQKNLHGTLDAKTLLAIPIQIKFKAKFLCKFEWVFV